MTAILELDRVWKVYPGTPPVEPVRGVTLSVDQGELLAIVGPSGSGKSTLLHLMAALDRPTSGEVRVAGEAVGTLPDRRVAGLRAHRLGMVFQQFFLLESLNALDNVATGWATGPPPCRAGSASGWRSPGRWSASPRSCSPTSPPATSTARPVPTSSCCWGRSTGRGDHGRGHARPWRRRRHAPPGRAAGRAGRAGLGW